MAFNTLSEARTAGMSGHNPIAISEVLAFCELVGIANYELRSKYLLLVREMDQVCLTHWADNNKKAK